MSEATKQKAYLKKILEIRHSTQLSDVKHIAKELESSSIDDIKPTDDTSAISVHSTIKGNLFIRINTLNINSYR